MTKNATKRALLSSALALVVCISMLIGTTYAWFTDSVTSTNNIIKSGNLDVELYYMNDETSDWTEVNANTNIFKENTLWEPGHTEVVKLKVVNEGTLALKYQLGVNIASEVKSVSVLGNELALSDYIKYAVIDGEQDYNRDTAVAAAEAKNATALKTAYNSGTTELKAKDSTNSGEKIVTMVVYMPETVGNEANYASGKAQPTIYLGINLFATQVGAEYDSFDNTYDKDAWNDGFNVYTAEDLQAALNNGKDVVLMNNIEGAINITEDVAINLNGNTFTGTILAPDANITLANGKIANDNRSASAIEINSGSLVIKDVEIESARHALRIDGPVDVIINNGTFKTVPVSGQTQHALNISGGATVTINDGTFIGPKGTASDSGSAVAAKNSDVKIYGGNFSGGKPKTISGSITVYGGTFDQDPATYATVADGCSVQNDDGQYSVVTDPIVDKGTYGGVDWTLTKSGKLTVSPAQTPVADTNSGKTYEVGAWREAVRYNSKGEGVAIEGWPYDRSKVTKLIIEEGVTSIGSFAAQGFTSLTGEVVIPSTVTYIGQEAFQKSTFTKLTFAEGGTEELCIAQGAFKNLNIEEVSLPADRPVHLHAWVFNNCHQLKNVTLPASLVSVHGTNHIDYFKDFNAHSNPTWTKASEIFAYDEKLETITFGSEAVRDMFFANFNATAKDYIVAYVGLTAYSSLEKANEAAQISGEPVVKLK